MKKFLLLILSFFLSTSLSAQVTYSGNGASGFGGPIGGGSLEVSDDGTNITFTITRGGGDMNDDIVIYIDSKTGGFTSTSTFTDTGDRLRRAISGLDGGGDRNQIDFASGFQPDYVVAAGVSSTFGGIWELVGSGSHTYITSANLTPNNSTTATSYTLTVPKSNIGISGTISFSFVVTYLNGDSAFRSDETFLNSFSVSGNPGDSGTLTMTGFLNYPNTSGLETLTGSMTGSEGWRMLSTPTSSTTYSSLLGDMWTQGIATGADYTGGDSNVRTYNGSAFVTVDDLTATMTAGHGFIFYAYQKDDGPSGSGSFPKTLSLTGTENSGNQSVSLVTTSADGWNLVGNPFATTVDWDSFTKANLTTSAYVYNASTSSYISWNGTTGDLSNGLIAPFQGFWIQNASSGTPSLTIPTSAKSTGATFYKEQPRPVVRLQADMGDLTNSTHFSFTDLGSIVSDNADAIKLTPLDFKNHLSLSSDNGESYLDINNLPLDLEQTLEIPVLISAYEAGESAFAEMSGEVTLSWTATAYPANWTLELIDNENGTIIDLNAQESYTFNLIPSTAKVAYNMDKGPKMIAATNDSRFTLRVGPTITSNEEEFSAKPASIQLLQNYPNPFNPSTQIAFELPEAMTVKLTVFDALGREVATLLNGSAQAGMNAVTWNASNVSSGIYYYQLNAANTVMTKKMTLIK